MDLIEVAVAYANAVALHDPRGNTDCRAVRRDFLKNYGVGGDFGVVAYLHRSQNSCARADQHVVSQGRVAFSGVLAGAAECDILVERTVVADFSSFADNDARAVVDKQTLADLSAGVYLNAGSVAAALGYPPGNEEMPVFVEPVRPAVRPHRLERRIKEYDLQRRPHGGVARLYRIYLFFETVKHSNLRVSC